MDMDQKRLVFFGGNSQRLTHPTALLLGYFLLSTAPARCFEDWGSEGNDNIKHRSVGSLTRQPYYFSRIRTGGFLYDTFAYSIRFWRKGYISANCSYWMHLKKIVLLIKYWKSQGLLEAPACWIYQHLTQTTIIAPPHTHHYMKRSPRNPGSLSDAVLFMPSQHPLPPHTAFVFH